MRKYLTPFIMLCLVGLTARMGYQLARSPVLPGFARDLGAGPELIGFILAASTITGVCVKLPAGALSDILGRRRMLVLGGLFFAFPPFLYLLVNNAPALLALRFLHGFATAIFSPVASAAVADLFEQARGERMGWFASANEVGSAVAPLLGGLLLSLTDSGYKLVYLVVGVFGVATMLLVLRLPVGARTPLPPRLTPTLRDGDGAALSHPRDRTGDRTAAAATGDSRWKRFRQGIGQVMRNRQILVASSAEAAMFLGVGALVGFLPLYASKHANLSDTQVGVVLAGQLVMALVGKPLTGRLSDRLGRKPMIVAGLLLCALVLPLVPLTRSFPLLVFEGVLFGLGMAVVTPSTTALVTDLSKAGGYGAALGVFGTIWDVGEALGPILAGALIGVFAATSNAYLPAFIVVGALMAVAAVAFSRAVWEQWAGVPAG